MSHVRQQIREEIAAILGGLVSVPAANVFVSRAYPVNDESLPCVLIYSARDELMSEASAMSGKRGYLLQTNVEVRVRPVAAADALTDTICAEIQAALAADDTLGGLVKDLDLYSTDIGFDGEAENPTGYARLAYGALYRIAKGDPETALS